MGWLVRAGPNAASTRFRSASRIGSAASAMVSKLASTSFQHSTLYAVLTGHFFLKGADITQHALRLRPFVLGLPPSVVPADRVPVSICGFANDAEERVWAQARMSRAPPDDDEAMVLCTCWPRREMETWRG